MNVSRPNAKTRAAEAESSQDRPEGAKPNPYRSPDRRAGRRILILAELADMAMHVARAMELQALAEVGTLAQSDAAQAAGTVFVRVARAVRQTLALEEKMEERLAARRSRAEAERIEREADDRKALTAARKRVVERAVKKAIDAEADADETESLFDSLDERLDDYETFGDFTDKPLGEIVAGICRDIGLEPDHGLWDNELWMQDEDEIGPLAGSLAKSPVNGSARRAPDDDEDNNRNGVGLTPAQPNGHDPPLN